MENQGLCLPQQDLMRKGKTGCPKNMVGALAGWLNSMSTNPDPNFPQVLQAEQ